MISMEAVMEVPTIVNHLKDERRQYGAVGEDMGDMYRRLKRLAQGAPAGLEHAQGREGKHPHRGRPLTCC